MVVCLPAPQGVFVCGRKWGMGRHDSVVRFILGSTASVRIYDLFAQLTLGILT